MADQIIPLDTSPGQSFAVALAVDGKPLRLQLRIDYNEMAGYWTLDIADQNGVEIASSLPMLCGCWPAANILGQFGYLAIGSAYLINLGSSTADYPTKTNLGTDFQLLWSDTAA